MVTLHTIRARLLPVAAAAMLLLTASGALTFAANDNSVLPANWHIHDGQGATLGPQHKGIGFFPTILGISSGTYLLDPARCPNATDKAFLPSYGNAQGPFLRAGECRTSTVVIAIRTVPVGTAGPDGWSSLTVGSEPGWVTFYQVTPI